MENQEVKYLLALQKYGNVTKAAESLFISQPGLSRYLKAREAEIGTPLFLREKGRLVPTELGRLYLSYAASIAELEQQCDEAVRDYLGRHRAVLTIGIPASRVEQLTPFLSQLQTLNPNTEFNMVTGHSTELWEGRRQKQLDAIIYNQYGTRSGDLLLNPEEILLSIPPEVQARLGLPAPDSAPDGIPTVELTALANETFFLSSEQNMVGKMAQLIFEQEGFRPRSAKVLDNSLLAMTLARKETGIYITISSPWGKPVQNVYRLSRRYYNYLCLALLSSAAKRLTLPPGAEE